MAAQRLVGQGLSNSITESGGSAETPEGNFFGLCRFAHVLPD